MNAIMVGYTGRVKMINAIFGDGKANRQGFTVPRSASPTRGSAVVEGRARPLTPAAFDAMFGHTRPRKFVVPARGAVREIK